MSSGNNRRLALGYNQKRSQMINLKLQKTDNSDVVSNISYDYYYSGGGGSGGNNGRVRYITDHLDGNYSVDVGYDDHNRLTSYGSYRSYTYDAWNNLLSVSSSNGVGEAPNYTLSYATNASGAPATNRINNSGYTFDNAGNVTNDGSLAYAYDAAGRLKTAGTNNSCEYDGDGRKKGAIGRRFHHRPFGQHSRGLQSDEFVPRNHARIENRLIS